MLLPDTITFINNSDLSLQVSDYERTWEFYCRQYVTAFSTLLDVARDKDYYTNYRNRAFLFLLRHSLELLMKYNLSQSDNLEIKKTVLSSHKLNLLAEAMGITQDDFEQKFSILQCDSEGDCFRYFSNKQSERYYKNEILDCFDTCQSFIHFYNKRKPVDSFPLDELEDNKIIRHELRFYMNESLSLENVAFHYDFTISDLLKEVSKGKVSLNDIYLPLLFLIRHTIELKLKSNLKLIGSKCENLDSFINTHSLSKLWKVFCLHIESSINRIDNEEFKKESESYYRVAKSFVDLVAELDANSFVFRFPLDKKGNPSNFKPKQDILKRVLELYVQSDVFLSFAIDVLFREGYLEIGDEIIREWME